MAPQDSKIVVEVLQSVNNRTQILREMACYADIVINTLLGRVTRHPAGMHCPSWDDAFVSSFCFFLSRSESGAPCVRGVHSSNTHCVAVYRPISTRFAVFFQKGPLFQTGYIVLTFVARSRHNFREIAVKNCGKCKNRRKRLCAPLRIDS